MGELAYDHAKDANMVNFTGNTEFYSHVEKIDTIKNAISKKENEIDVIKSQYNIPEEDVKEIEPLSEKQEEIDKDSNDSN